MKISNAQKLVLAKRAKDLAKTYKKVYFSIRFNANLAKSHT